MVTGKPLIESLPYDPLLVNELPSVFGLLERNEKLYAPLIADQEPKAEKTRIN